MGMGMGCTYSSSGGGGSGDQWMVGENGGGGSPSTSSSPSRKTHHHHHHSNSGSSGGSHSSENMTSHVPFSSQDSDGDGQMEQGQGLGLDLDLDRGSSPDTPLTPRSERSLEQSLKSSQGLEQEPGPGHGLGLRQGLVVTSDDNNSNGNGNPPSSSSQVPILVKNDSVLHHTINSNNSNHHHHNTIDSILHSQCLHINAPSSSSSSSRSAAKTTSGGRVGRGSVIGSSIGVSSSSGKRPSSSSSYQHFYALPDDKFMASLGALNYDDSDLKAAMSVSILLSATNKSSSSATATATPPRLQSPPPTPLPPSLLTTCNYTIANSTLDAAAHENNSNSSSNSSSSSSSSNDNNLGRSNDDDGVVRSLPPQPPSSLSCISPVLSSLHSSNHALLTRPSSSATDGMGGVGVRGGRDSVICSTTTAAAVRDYAPGSGSGSVRPSSSHHLLSLSPCIGVEKNKGQFQGQWQVQGQGGDTASGLDPGLGSMEEGDEDDSGGGDVDRALLFVYGLVRDRKIDGDGDDDA